MQLQQFRDVEETIHFVLSALYTAKPVVPLAFSLSRVVPYFEPDTPLSTFLTMA